MNRVDIANEISKRTGIDKLTSRKVLEYFALIASERLIFGEEIVIRGLGKLKFGIKPSREKFNVNTRTFETIKKRYKVVFKACRNLTNSVNKKTVY